MALNPFFLQGSQSEQRLIQELINEQLKIYGVEVTYIPRKIVNQDNIFNEIQSSKFNDNFLLEAYVNTYEGHGGSGDILTKFGMSLKDELTITISKERFEDFIAPFLQVMPDSEVGVYTRPREGDLIYFPLGRRIFEVKFVEHEKPFYQLGKNYVYELKCELFEYEDEMGGWDQLSTTTDAIDEVLENQGYITTLKLISIGSTATVGLSTVTGYIRKITLTDDGYGYTKVPTVQITSAPEFIGVDATAVAITTSINNVYSVKEILITNPGSGYVDVPTVTIVGATETIKGVGIVTYGVGAAATATLVTTDSGIGEITTSDGSGYTSIPTITFGTPSSGIGTAIGQVTINSTTNVVTGVRLSDAGIGYTSGTAIATISAPPIITGIGTFQFNEVVTGSVSGATARVKTWDVTTNTLKVGTTNGTFVPLDIIVGSASSARYSVDYIETAEFSDKYDKSTEIEAEADLIIDFSESNPFGSY